MKVSFLPKTKLGRWSLIFFLVTIVLMVIFYGIIAIFDPQGTGTFFGTPELAIPLILAWVSSAAALVLGIISLIKSPSKSIFILVVVILTFLTTLYGVLEIAIPH